jgi:hypothetical protein
MRSCVFVFVFVFVFVPCVCALVTQSHAFILISQLFEDLLWAGTRSRVTYYGATTDQASHINSEVARCCVEILRGVLLDGNVDSASVLPSSAPDTLPSKLFDQLVEFRKNLNAVEAMNQNGDEEGGMRE